MPENEFEKEVQQKITGLKLKPNDEVWHKVAGAITKRKTDRKFFVFILLLLCFSTVGIFLVYENTKQHQKSVNEEQKNILGGSTKIETVVKKDKKEVTLVDASNGNTDAVNEKVVAGNTITKKTNEKRVTSLKYPTLPKPEPAANIVTRQPGEQLTKSSNKLATSHPQAGVKNAIISNKEKPIATNQPIGAGIARHSNEKIEYKKKERLSTKISSGSVEASQSETATLARKENLNVKDEAVTAMADAGNKVTTDSSAKLPPDKAILTAKEVTAPLKKPGEKTNAVAKKSTHLKQLSKWKLGLQFSAGVTATNNQYLGIIGSSNSDANKAYADQASGSVSAGTPGTRIVYYPSKVKPAAGFIAGLFVQKSTGSKTSISVGINYKTYNTRMTVGNQMDSIVPANNYLNLNSAAYTFYRTGSSLNYTNHFHFLELPVTLNITLNKQHKRAVYLTTGIALATLIGSNALQFDTASGKYYSNNKLLNKTQVNVSIGAQFALSRTANNPLLIGPDINFSLSKVAKQSLYEERRYSYFGLRFQKSFGKK